MKPVFSFIPQDVAAASGNFSLRKGEQRSPTPMIQRFRGTHTAVEELWPKFFEQIKTHKACADEIWFSTGIGFPPIDWHKQHSERLARYADECRRAGIAPALQFQSVFGHGDFLIPFTDDISGKNWRGWVGRNGSEAIACSCPTDPNLRTYFVELAKIYSAWQPSSIWLDDDFSTRGRTVDPWSYCEPFGHGCYCERCLGGFYQFVGKTWISREAFLCDLDADAVLSDQWMSYTYDNIAALATAIATAVHEISPATRMGCQHGAQTHYPRQLAIYEALHNATGLPVGCRPGGGAYTDYSPFDLVEKVFHEGLQMRAIGMPEWINPVCPEVENCPRTVSCKTMRGIETESLLALGAGMNSLSYFATDATLEEPTWYGENIFKPLAEDAPYFRRYLEISEGTTPMGLGIAPLDNISPLSAVLGVPILAAPGISTGMLLQETAAKNLSQEELLSIFRHGVIMDGPTAQILIERGFGNHLGELRATRFSGSIREDFTDDPLNFALPSRQHGATNFFTFTASAAKEVRTLGSCFRYTGEKLGDATLCVTTHDGFRYSVLGAGTFRNDSLSSGRILQLGRIADWVSGNTLPLRIDTPALVVSFVKVRPNGDFANAVLCNARIDELSSCQVTIRNFPTEATLVWNPPHGEAVELVVHETGRVGEISAMLPDIRPWETGYLEARVRLYRVGKD